MRTMASSNKIESWADFQWAYASLPSLVVGVANYSFFNGKEVTLFYVVSPYSFGVRLFQEVTSVNLRLSLLGLPRPV